MRKVPRNRKPIKVDRRVGVPTVRNPELGGGRSTPERNRLRVVAANWLSLPRWFRRMMPGTKLERSFAREDERRRRQINRGIISVTGRISADGRRVV